MSTPKNEILTGDCLELIGQLDDNSINTVVTSPPYATQRETQYNSISETDYPAWFTTIMTALKPKMTPDGSVLVVIRANVAKGCLSDYVLRTRLAVRESGWIEPDELVWVKAADREDSIPSGPPLGSNQRPRRSWENILWFSPTTKPYVDLKACGNPKSKRTNGYQGSTRFGMGEMVSGVSAVTSGTSNVTDVFRSPLGDIDRGVMHPAMYPVSLCQKLIMTFSKTGDVILDPFAGSGSTLLAAISTKRLYIGMELSEEYVKIAQERIETDTKYQPEPEPELESGELSGKYSALYWNNDNNTE
jgi:DNA modification methylase